MGVPDRLDQVQNNATLTGTDGVKPNTLARSGRVHWQVTKRREPSPKFADMLIAK